MKDTLRKRLLDAAGACHLISQFTHGIDYPRYASDALIRSAVERQLEIVGEALNLAVQDEPGLEDAIPDLRRIVGLRNRIIHGYDSVDDLIVWDVVKTKVPPLLARLEDLMLST